MQRTRPEGLYTGALDPNGRKLQGFRLFLFNYRGLRNSREL